MSATAEISWIAGEAILGIDPSAALYRDISRWFEKVKMFQREENERMIDKDPTAEDLKAHKALVLRLIDDGEHLVNLAKHQGGMPQNPQGIKLGDLESTVEMLGDSYRGWHEPMPEERRQQLLKEIFGDVA